MKTLILISLCSCLLLSCIHRDWPVDKSELTGNDYRLFQNTPAWELAKAVEDEDLEEIDDIVSSRPELINYQEPKFGQTLLMLTVLNRQLKPFKALLQRKADVNIHDTYDGASAIIEACTYGSSDIRFVENLVEFGANVNDIEVGKRRPGNSTRDTPLILASRAGLIKIVKFLVAKGADINYQDEFGRSALRESCFQKEYETALFLLQHGADFKRPLFYRPDYSIPSEKQDPNDKGEPIYLANSLREDFVYFHLHKYKYKMLIVDFLKSKGIDYQALPIPEKIKKRVKKEFPNNWQEILAKY